MQSNNLLNILREYGAILDGHFLLTSGRHSDIYIEKFRLLENPNSLEKVCFEMAEIVLNKKIDIVLGAAIGGILIAGGVGRRLDKKHIFSERINGKMDLRRGFSINKGDRVVIVEDIITTGGSVFELIQLAEKYGAEIVHVVNLVDRSPEGINFSVSSTALLKIPSESWIENECPLCIKGVELTQRGRSGKVVV